MNIPFSCFILSLIIFAFIVVVSFKKWGNLKQVIKSMTPTRLAEYFLWMIAGVFLLIAGIFGRYFTYFKGDLSNAHGDWGTFGDYIGGTLNPIRSFLSLIALLATIVLQSKELKLSRKELKRSASAQEDTKAILRKQSESEKIENEQVSENEKMYRNIVRSFLGYDITQLLAINCYCSGPEDTYWKYKLLIERYAFLEHMPFELDKIPCPLLEKTKTIYKESAFGNSNFVNKKQ